MQIEAQIETHVEQLAIELAQRREPEEACALLLGPISEKGRSITELRPCRNVAVKPEQAFRIDPLELRRIEEQSLPRGLRIYGVFHSHPRGPRVFSREDLQACPSGWQQMLAIPGEFGFEILLWEL